MDTQGSDPQHHLPLTPATLNILLAVAGGERHGYAIMREVAERTDGAVRLGPTTLYRSIKQMLQRGWIEESAHRPDPDLDDERRRYYRMTDLGRRVATAEIQRLEALVSSARRAGLTPPGGHSPAEASS